MEDSPTITYGISHIPINIFQKTIATQGLKINTIKTPVGAKINTSLVSALAKSLTAGITSTNSRS